MGQTVRGYVGMGQSQRSKFLNHKRAHRLIIYNMRVSPPRHAKTPKRQICRWSSHFAVCCIPTAPRQRQSQRQKLPERQNPTPMTPVLPELHANRKIWRRQEPARAMPNTPLLANNLSHSRTRSRRVLSHSRTRSRRVRDCDILFE
jgi:hypothetical protein